MIHVMTRERGGGVVGVMGRAGGSTAGRSLFPYEAFVRFGVWGSVGVFVGVGVVPG